MSNIEHIFFFSLLFIVFILITINNQNYINKHFWRCTLLPVVAYGLIVGLRYGWGADYLYYMRRMMNPKYFEGMESPGFLWLNLFLKDLGFNFVADYVFYSFLFVICSFVFIKDFNKNKYMLALLLPATLIFTTSIIRQGIALSFTFIMLYALQRGKKLVFVMGGAITYLVHPGALLYLAPCLLFFFLSRGRLIPIKLSVPLYVLCSLSTNLFKDYIADPLQNLLFGMTFGNIGFMNEYAKRSDDWFGAGAIIEDWYQGPVTLTLSMIFHISIIVLGYFALKNNKYNKVVYLYNTVTVGWIVFRLFFPVEIMHRLTDPMTMLYFVPFGYALYEYYTNRNIWSPRERTIGRWLVLGAYLYLVPYFLRFIFMFPEGDFVWNANI